VSPSKVTRERQRADVLARLEDLDGVAKGFGWGGGLREQLQARLDQWTELLAGEPMIARQILRRLIDGHLTLTLTPKPETRTYESRVRATTTSC
jgi:hypothetical protein